MIHMGCVWSEKAQSLLSLPLFCHLGEKRECVELIFSLFPSVGGLRNAGLIFPKHLQSVWHPLEYSYQKKKKKKGKIFFFK